ncbi:hypothetical protein ALC57_17585 [Trachymyrmex cornetzi]|uniref:Uncharacterized protein n=1 Tax=Trachymyrmex cornetzi TaxID=471704 RepID=A0A151ITL2_9HYME|nr:hypothetical protein ALC57_17585 [Trachymyrmex cornetzi]
MSELHEKWNCIRRQSSSLQSELAKELTRNAGVTIPEQGCGTCEIELFQRYLATENIAIIVFNFSTFGRGENLVYDGCTLLDSLGREPSIKLYIRYYERKRHFNPILNVKAAAGSRGGYCVACNMGYRKDRGHRCIKKCPCCHAIPSCESPDAQLIRRFVKLNSKHECEISYCRTCRSLQPSNHSCFMRPLRCKVVTENPGEGTSSATIQEDVTHASENEPKVKDKKRDRVAFVFYDFETRQDETYEGTENVKIHVPTLCVAHQI